jgi:hypothetical protein
MADVRKDQNEAVTKAAEATRAGARETANRTEEALRTGIEGVRRVTEEFSKTFGFTAQNPDLTRQAARNLEAITETGAGPWLPGNLTRVDRVGAGAAPEEHGGVGAARAVPQRSRLRRCPERTRAREPARDDRQHPPARRALHASGAGGGAGDYGGDWQGGRTFPSGGVAVTRATGVIWWRVPIAGNGWKVCGQRRSPILADHLVANWASSLELALAHFQTTFKFVADSVPVRDRPRPR